MNPTSGKGLYHNLNNWNYDVLNNFKLQDQDHKNAIRAFELSDNQALKDYAKMLKKWDENHSAFEIDKDHYDLALDAFKKLANLEEQERRSNETR